MIYIELIRMMIYIELIRMLIVNYHKKHII